MEEDLTKENIQNNESYKIAILEDDNEAGRLLSEYFLKYGEEKNIKFEIKIYSLVKDFIDKYVTSDLVLIDIELPDGNGFETSTLLRKHDKDVMIIFVTNMAQYAIKGYEVSAFDFIVKPVNYYKLSMKIDRAMVNLKAKKKSQQKKMLIKTIKENITISPSEIYYIEVMGHSLIYHTIYGDYEVYGTMNKASKELENEQFEFCNRCYFVNLAHVNSVKGYECKVGNDIIQISHLKKKNFMEKLNNYFVFGDKK